jgi:hypothetical protein
MHKDTDGQRGQQPKLLASPGVVVEASPGPGFRCRPPRKRKPHNHGSKAEADKHIQQESIERDVDLTPRPAATLASPSRPLPDMGTAPAYGFRLTYAR